MQNIQIFFVKNMKKIILSGESVDALVAYPYPGNVREMVTDLGIKIFKTVLKRRR